MTAMQRTPQQTNVTTLVLMAGVLGIVAGVLLAVLNTPVGRVMTTPHATERHGTEAAQARECLEQNGPIQTWQQDGDPSVQIFCVEVQPPPCPKWAIVISQVWPSIVDGCDLRERTSFQPADGTPSKVIRYLERFAKRID